MAPGTGHRPNIDSARLRAELAVECRLWWKCQSVSVELRRRSGWVKGMLASASLRVIWMLAHTRMTALDVWAAQGRRAGSQVKRSEGGGGDWLHRRVVLPGQIPGACANYVREGKGKKQKPQARRQRGSSEV